MLYRMQAVAAPWQPLNRKCSSYQNGSMKPFWKELVLNSLCGSRAVVAGDCGRPGTLAGPVPWLRQADSDGPRRRPWDRRGKASGGKGDTTGSFLSRRARELWGTTSSRTASGRTVVAGQDPDGHTGFELVAGNCVRCHRNSQRLSPGRTLMGTRASNWAGGNCVVSGILGWLTLRLAGGTIEGCCHSNVHPALP